MQVSSSAAGTPVAASSARPIRVWFPILLLVVYWSFIYAVYNLQMAMFPRFMLRMVALGVMFLLMLGWWLTNRRFSWRERLLAVAVMVACIALVGLVSDRTVTYFMIVMAGFPIFATAAIAWLTLSRSAEPRLRRAGFLLVAVLSFGYFGLIRWDGLDGAQHSQESWRWTPTAEQLFLASRQGAAPTVNEAAEKPLAAEPGDWLEFRGPAREGVVRGVRLATDWNDNPPKQIWKQRVGPGWSSMIIVSGLLITQEQRGQSEAVVSYNAADGREVWAYEDASRFDDQLSGIGPRATPTFNNGHIYALGAKGKLVCLDAKSGKVVWSHDTATDAEAEPPQWGYSVSPLVVDGLVIAFAGGEHDKSLLAYRADTGDLAWSCAAGSLTYSSPHLVTLDGQQQILMQDNKALLAVSIQDGKELWRRPDPNAMAMPMLQPHAIASNELVIQSDPGIARVEIHHDGDKTIATDRWKTEGLKPAYNDFAIHDGHIYGLDDGILCCVDLENGKRLWKGGRYGHGQLLLLADQGALLILTEKGEVALVAANPKNWEEIARFPAINGKTWNHPTIAHGRLYVRNDEEMACFELKLAESL